MNDEGSETNAWGPPFPVAPIDRGHGSLAPRRGAGERVGAGERLAPVRRSRGGFQTATLKLRAAELRRNATPAETALWEVLRGKRLGGFKFRRQHQIGTYIVDFACVQERLVVELLGSIHDSPEAQRQDALRTRFLNEAGYRVLEIPNEIVTHTIADARELIIATLQGHPAPPRILDFSLTPLRGERDPRPRSVGAAGKGGPHAEGESS